MGLGLGNFFTKNSNLKKKYISEVGGMGLEREGCLELVNFFLLRIQI